MHARLHTNAGVNRDIQISTEMTKETGRLRVAILVA